MCVCLLLQDLLQSCSLGWRKRVEDMCYERRRAEACVDESAHHALFFSFLFLFLFLARLLEIYTIAPSSSCEKHLSDVPSSLSSSSSSSSWGTRTILRRRRAVARQGQRVDFVCLNTPSATSSFLPRPPTRHTHTKPLSPSGNRGSVFWVRRSVFWVTLALHSLAACFSLEFYSASGWS